LPLGFEEFLHFNEMRELLRQKKNTQALRGDNLFVSTKELFAELEKFIIFGGYPEVILSDKKQTKIEILKSIFDLYIRKELIEYLKIDKILETKKLIQYLSVNNAQKIKYQEVAQIAGFSQKTVKNYIGLLKETFLIVETKPFFTNRNKELVKIPKVYFLDTGVSNFFINNFNGFDLRKDASFLFENYILSELIKGGIEPDSIKFWQDKNQTEVDFIIEQKQRLAAIEVKFKKSVSSDDTSSLNIFRRGYPNAGCLLVNFACQGIFKKIRTSLPYNITGVISKL
jgi:predicted AAA+ superfamily ATPase